jgi:MraZ protein
LVSYADLTKECVIIGVNDRLEIWNEEAFNALMEENSEELEEIAEDLFEVDYATL